jgi:single-stranded-DNA-specific exonuclease
MLRNNITLWQAVDKQEKEIFADPDEIINLLLTNRGIKTAKQKSEFILPPHPSKLTLTQLKIRKRELGKAVARLKIAKQKKQKIIIYGDYDADGICASAILWECLYARGFDILPYLPDRAKEGYGIKAESVKRLKDKYKDLALVITVDNGIVANKQIDEISKMDIDVIITDHHQIGKSLPKACAIVHTDLVCGAALSWVFSREIKRNFGVVKKGFEKDSLDLAAIGTIADQMQLVGVNRSFAKHGLEVLNRTTRKGLISLYDRAGIKKASISTYDVNYLIAPRINAVGRISHALESLRLLCIRNDDEAHKLALHLDKVNKERQNMVDRMVVDVLKKAEEQKGRKALVISGKNYNQGVIGLAAGKLSERFYKPAIVIAEEKALSKASARSISGFNIVEALRKQSELLEDVGGHPMAAGFSIKTKNIKKFRLLFQNYAAKHISSRLLTPSLKIDMGLNFKSINDKLVKSLELFEPTGYGNYSPLFATYSVEVLEAKKVGRDQKHLKLVLKKSDRIFEAIAFGAGENFNQLGKGKLIDIAYSIEENVWNGAVSIQLKLKDLKIKK